MLHGGSKRDAQRKIKETVQLVDHLGVSCVTRADRPFAPRQTGACEDFRDPRGLWMPLRVQDQNVCLRTFLVLGAGAGVSEPEPLAAEGVTSVERSPPHGISGR